MKKLSPNDALELEIASLKIEKQEELAALKLQFKEVHESLKPINLIKDAFKSVTHSPDVNEGIDKTVIGVTTGFLIKNLFFRKSHNPLKIVASLALQAITSSVAAHNSDKIKNVGQRLLHGLLTRINLKKTSAPTHELPASF